MWAEVKTKFSQKEHDSDIFAEVEECLEMESEIPAVHQEWVKLPIEEDEYNAIKRAEEFLHKKNVIIPYKVCTNKTRQNLLMRKKELSDTIKKFEIVKGVSRRTSKMIGCKSCGSSMAREYFAEGEHTCKVCGNDLWSETNLKAWTRYADAMEIIEEKLKKCRDTYDVFYYVQASLKTK